MKKAFLNWRYYLMMVLGVVTMLGVFSVPNEEMPLIEWAYKLALSKIIGFGAGYAVYRLMRYWENRNLVPELSKLLEEE